MALVTLNLYDGERLDTQVSINPGQVSSIEELGDNDEACRVRMANGDKYKVSGARTEVLKLLGL